MRDSFDASRIDTPINGRERFAEQRWAQLRRRVVHPAWFGTLRRTHPLSSSWGFDRGTPIDRYYVEHFLSRYRTDIYGNVLEVQDNGYTRHFGEHVTRSDVLDINPYNPQATIVADLAAADAIADNSFDCFVLTQTLHLIFDLESAVAHACRLLRPGGVLLATLPAVSRVSRSVGVDGDFWRLTAGACCQLFGQSFGPSQVTVHSYGNVLTAVAFLSGIAREELKVRELDTHDPYFPVVIGVRAEKAENVS